MIRSFFDNEMNHEEHEGHEVFCTEIFFVVFVGFVVEQVFVISAAKSGSSELSSVGSSEWEPTAGNADYPGLRGGCPIPRAGWRRLTASVFARLHSDAASAGVGGQVRRRPAILTDPRP